MDFFAIRMGCPTGEVARLDARIKGEEWRFNTYFLLHLSQNAVLVPKSVAVYRSTSAFFVHAWVVIISPQRRSSIT